MNKQLNWPWFSYVLLCTLLLASFDSVHAYVDPPELRCISVDSNGFATLTWIPPADPNNEFLSYTVYSSPTIGGPYTPTTVNGIATNTFTDVIAANINSLYYFVQTEYDDGTGPASSLSSDTAQTILPTFTFTTDSTCTLSWNPLFNPNIASNLGTYSVYRRIGTSGGYQFIGNTTYGSEFFSDQFKVCVDSIFYYIEIGDALGCISRSAVLVDEFEDNTAPAVPILDSVSVDGAGNVTMGWRPSSSLDTDGYIIVYHQKAPSQDVIIDTVWARPSTTYTEILAAIDPTTIYEELTLAAFDNCYNLLANTSAAADFQQTIFLSTTPDLCGGSVDLTWTRYIRWNDIDEYEILVSVDGGAYQSLGSQSGTDTTFLHEGVNSLQTYCYKIRVHNTSRTKTSTSNEVCVISNSTIIPSVHYLAQVTVENTDHILTRTLTDSTLPVASYVLERSLPGSGSFFEVSKTVFSGGSEVILEDYEAKVDETPYDYRVGIIDTCGQVVYYSRPANSMYLQATMDEELLVELNWNPYQGWDSVGSGVERYEIYQSIDGNRKLLDVVGPGTLEYSHSVLNDIQMGATFCYEIQAMEGPGNFYNRADSSLSNRVCLTRNLTVYIPNAFRPSGFNPIFKPVISFGELATYSMVIYDRWGTQVFETRSIEQGWDGYVDGKLAGFGQYVYEIQVSNFAGATYSTSGAFVLLQ